MKNILIIALLTFCSFSSQAINLGPSSNAESEHYPAATNCSIGSNTATPSIIPIAYSYQGGLQVWAGTQLNCSLPIKSDRYVERIVFDYTLDQRSIPACKVGFARAVSGETVANVMTAAQDGNMTAWYYDNLGSQTQYVNTYFGHVLYLTCWHSSFPKDSWMRYGVIRVDYTPAP